MQENIRKGPEKCRKDIKKRAENGQKWLGKYWRMLDNRNECQIWINRMGERMGYWKKGLEQSWKMNQKLEMDYNVKDLSK